MNLRTPLAAVAALALALSGATVQAQTATDQNEGLRIAPGTQAGTYALSWWGRAGRTYFIQHNEDLTNPYGWVYVPIVESGANQIIQWGGASNGSKSFFRLIYSDAATGGNASTADFDGDGVTNLDEVNQGTDPFDYYNDVLTNVSIDSGNNQSAGPNAWVANPLVVNVTDGTTNAAKANAPIVFASPTAQLAASLTGTGSSSVEVRSNAQGKATVYLKLPATGIFHQVTASANHGAPVIFHASLAQLNPSPTSISLSVDQGVMQERTITLVNSTSRSINYAIDPPLVSAGLVPEPPQDASNPEYNWLVSGDVGASAYVWNDISTTGTKISGVTDSDDGSAQISIPFNFPFYGSTYTFAYVSSNGYITFGTSPSSIRVGSLPNSSQPALIAPFNDDLNPNRLGDVYYKADASKVTIQYEGVGSYNTSFPYTYTGTYTFQIVLESSGAITFYYKAINNAVSNATVGIQSGATPRHARQILLNITSGLAIAFHVPGQVQANWLRLQNYSGTVAAGQSASVDVTLDSTALAAGTYTTTLHLKDSAGNTVGPDVPISWTVSDNAVVDSDHDGLPDAWEMLHFGNLNQGANDDPDHDGLSNLLEYRLGSDPLNPDTNGDGIIDGVAYRLGISTTNLDMDGDGVTNAVERQRGTNPFVGPPGTPYTFPFDPANPLATSTNINDHTAFTITLLEPANAVPMQP